MFQVGLSFFQAIKSSSKMVTTEKKTEKKTAEAPVKVETQQPSRQSKKHGKM